MTPQRSQISIGDAAAHDFIIDAPAMEAFQALSGDTSFVHTEKEFAVARGYKDVIVYGGLMLAHLSHVVGELLPGKCGASVKWTITYRAPLYVGEAAQIRIEIVNISAAAGLVEGRYKIKRGDTLVAEGATQSIVPLDLVAGDDAAGDKG